MRHHETGFDVHDPEKTVGVEVIQGGHRSLVVIEEAVSTKVLIADDLLYHGPELFEMNLWES